MKKKLFLFGMILLLLCMAGCKKQEEKEKTPQEVSVTPQPEKVDFSNIEKHVVWYHDAMLTNTVDERIFTRFNQLLLERGYDFVVDFVTEPSITELEYRKYQKKLRDYKEQGKQVDLIFTGWSMVEGAATYDSAVQDGLLEPLDDYFASEKGHVLYEAFPENIWEMMQRDGKVYGISGNGWYGPYYSASLNADLLKKYKVEAPEEFSFEAYLAAVGKVYEKAAEEGEELLPLYLTADAVYSALGYYKLGDFWLRQNQDRTVEFVNPYEDEEARRIFVLLEKYRKKFGGFGTSEQYRVLQKSGRLIGSFHVTQMKFSFQNQCVDYPAVTYEPQKEFYSLPMHNVAFGVASWATYPEEAKQLLTLILTDEEFVNLLYYGVKGVNYSLENGHAVTSDARGLRAPGFESQVNEKLAYPVSAEPLNKKEVLQKQQEEVVFLSAKLEQFPDAQLSEEERKVAEIFREAEGLWLGEQENAVQKAEQYCEALKALHVEDILQRLTQLGKEE